jgi:hypothetical protein
VPALDRLLPTPGLVEVDTATLALAPDDAWTRFRHGNLASSPVVNGLVAVRTLPDRVLGHQPVALQLLVDDIVSTPEHPGFQMLVDDAPHEFAVGAIGQVWQLRIPFLHVADADAFVAFADPGWVKVAWGVRCTPLPGGTHVTVEVRVAGTDPRSFRRFRRYFVAIGPFSRYIRRSLLRSLTREVGPAEPSA